MLPQQCAYRAAYLFNLPNSITPMYDAAKVVQCTNAGQLGKIAAIEYVYPQGEVFNTLEQATAIPFCNQMKGACSF
jgi:hypothetical protein